MFYAFGRPNVWSAFLQFNSSQKLAGKKALEQLNEWSQLRVLESFFDSLPSDPPSLRKLWFKPNKTQLNDFAKSTVLLEASLVKQGKKTRVWKSRHYILTSEFLAYKEKPTSKSIKQIMNLERVKLEYIEVSEKEVTTKYGFKFSRNNKTTIMFTNEKSVYESFKKELDNRCVLHCFQEKYEVEKLIGKGSFGKVYLIRRRSDDKQFAAKMFFKDTVLKQKKGKESLFNEINILKTLNHPRIVKLFEVHETVLSIFLILELLEGGELFRRLKERRHYSEKDCALVLRRIIEPLVYLHEKEIMHRDIKPENLILRSKNSEYDVVIADFGLAQKTEDQFIHLRCGTPGYCAPEVLNWRTGLPDYTTKCDVFSVGCVFYHLVAGRGPFYSKYNKETLSLNRDYILSFDDHRIQSLSGCAQDLLQKMLEKDPAKRPSFKECLEHEFFYDPNRATNAFLFSFTRFTLPPQNPNTRSRDRDKTSQESHEDSISFFVGRSNLMKGMVETINEMSATIDVQKTTDLPGIERTQISRSTFMRHVKREESTLLSPFKQNSSKLQDLANRNKIQNDDYSIQSSSHSEDLGTFNSEENEDEVIYRQLLFIQKMQKITNDGTITNPFTEFVRIEHSSEFERDSEALTPSSNT